MRDAVVAHLMANGFAPDGGDSERWAVVRLGPTPIAYPNIAARRKEVRFHDLNHVVTGYATDLGGESEMSAWEIGSGCRGYWVAWLLDLSGLLSGLRRPRRTVQAFARGRQTRNLYSRDYEALLRQPVSDIRAGLGLDQTTRVRPRDVLLLLALAPAALVTSSVVVACALVTSPWWL